MVTPDCVASAGRRVWLLASGGAEGVAALGDTVEAGTRLAEIVRNLHLTRAIRARACN